MVTVEIMRVRTVLQEEHTADMPRSSSVRRAVHSAGGWLPGWIAKKKTTNRTETPHRLISNHPELIWLGVPCAAASTSKLTWLLALLRLCLLCFFLPFVEGPGVQAAKGTHARTLFCLTR